MRLLTLFVTCAILAFAQVNSGSIGGTVLDSSGVGVPNANVALVNEQTGVRLTGKATGAGNYLLAPLQRGRYTLEADAPGFKKTERAGLDLQVGDKLGVNLTLELGNLQETIVVKAESPLLVTTNASIGQVIDNTKIQELPLPGRNPLRLVQLAPQ